MADNGVYNDNCLLHSDHGDIRRDILSTSADIRREDAFQSGEILRQISNSAGDIRREVANEACDVSKQVMRAECDVRRDVADGAYRALMASDAVGDRLISQIDKQVHRIEARDFDIMKELVEFKGKATADHVGILAEIRSVGDRTSRDAEIYSLRNQVEMQKHAQYLYEKTAFEGAETRKLLNELKYGDLNRELIERNAKIVEERGHHNHYRHGWDQLQFQALSNQIQTLDSQISETRQGMVNFGTMLGVGQSSTSNNVR
jgi:hypothetical protein